MMGNFTPDTAAVLRDESRYGIMVVTRCTTIPSQGPHRQWAGMMSDKLRARHRPVSADSRRRHQMNVRAQWRSGQWTACHCEQPLSLCQQPLNIDTHTKFFGLEFGVWVEFNAPPDTAFYVTGKTFLCSTHHYNVGNHGWNPCLQQSRHSYEHFPKASLRQLFFHQIWLESVEKYCNTLQWAPD